LGQEKFRKNTQTRKQITVENSNPKIISTHNLGDDNYLRT
jgi:hypothetical protein